MPSCLSGKEKPILKPTSMKKVLIITYYWPPAGGPGVQRVLKFAKYLPEFGWQPIILTVKNGEYPAIDETLCDEIPKDCLIYKTTSLEPNQLYKHFVGMKLTETIPSAVITEKNPTRKKRLANWVRLNLFIPDAKIGWLPFAVHKGKKIIEQEKPDVIFSSSPPPTVHLIAKKLAKWSRTKWIADFRDPWTDMYYFDEIKKSRYTRQLEQMMEKFVLQKSNKLITVSRALANLFENKIDLARTVQIIPNGFDPEDFSELENLQPFAKFTIAYSGKLNPQQNPEKLWQALSDLIKTDEMFAANFQLLFMGNFSPAIHEAIDQAGLRPYFKDLGYVSHQEVLTNLNRSHLLLLIIPDTSKNEGILTGKVFDYLGAQRFVLGIGPKSGDVASILEETGAGRMIDFNSDPTEIIHSRFSNWLEKREFTVDPTKIARYSRKKQTEELVKIFEE